MSVTYECVVTLGRGLKVEYRTVYVKSTPSPLASFRFDDGVRSVQACAWDALSEKVLGVRGGAGLVAGDTVRLRGRLRLNKSLDGREWLHLDLVEFTALDLIQTADGSSRTDAEWDDLEEALELRVRTASEELALKRREREEETSVSCSESEEPDDDDYAAELLRRMSGKVPGGDVVGRGSKNRRKRT